VIPQEALDVLEGRARSAVLCCDGFALAAALGDSAVDMVLGDLPYDAKTHAGARTNKKGSDGNHKIDFAPLPPVVSFLPSLLACSRRWVLCFCAQRMFAEYELAAGEAWIRDGLWVRTNGTPQKTGDRPAQGAEGIAIMHRPGRKRWNGGGRPAVWNGPICDDPTRKHPTKKPLWLMEALLRDFAEPNDLVLDPTAGESTTGEACARLGLRYIGCEIDPEKHTWGVERVARALRSGVQMSLPAREKRMRQESMFDKDTMKAK
jgi:site-specific DNA-methyltransferase (adenine-specific)